MANVDNLISNDLTDNFYGLIEGQMPKQLWLTSYN